MELYCYGHYYTDIISSVSYAVQSKEFKMSQVVVTVIFFGPNRFMHGTEMMKGTVGGILLVLYHHHHHEY